MVAGKTLKRIYLGVKLAAFQRFGIGLSQNQKHN